jgi:hypothetical protein
MKTPLTLKQQRKRNLKDVRAWAALCDRAEKVLAGVPQNSCYHKLIHANKHTPAVFGLYGALNKAGFWDFFATRSHGYELGLLSKIFDKPAMPGHLA